jgi:hypothetical protein
MEQKTNPIEVANCRIARDLVVRDEITECFPLGCSDGPSNFSPQALPADARKLGFIDLVGPISRNDRGG